MGESPAHHLVVGDNLVAGPAAADHFGLWGNVAAVYCDPPYNTGGARGLTYKDQRGSHSDWVEFMRPRLALARELLAADGVLFLSIDDRELPYLWCCADEVFGAGNFVANFVWVKKRKGSHLSRSVRSTTEYVLCFAKDRRNVDLFDSWIDGSVAQPLLNRPNRPRTITLPAHTPTTLRDGWYQARVWGDGDLAVTSCGPLGVVAGETVNPVQLRARFKWGQEKLDAELAAGTTLELRGPSARAQGWRIAAKKLAGGRFRRPPSILDSRVGVGTNEDAFAELTADLGGRSSAFGYPKPISLIQYLLRSATWAQPDAWVVDLFAGTATTSIAAAALNDSDGGHRSSVSVTLDEAGIVDEVTWPRLTSRFSDRPGAGVARWSVAAEFSEPGDA